MRSAEVKLVVSFVPFEWLPTRTEEQWKRETCYECCGNITLETGAFMVIVR